MQTHINFIGTHAPTPLCSEQGAAHLKVPMLCNKTAFDFDNLIDIIRV